jgi:hypothetical protein
MRLAKQDKNVHSSPKQQIAELTRMQQKRFPTGPTDDIEVLSIFMVIHNVAERLPPKQAKIVQDANYEAFRSLGWT